MWLCECTWMTYILRISFCCTLLLLLFAPIPNEDRDIEAACSCIFFHSPNRPPPPPSHLFHFNRCLSNSFARPIVTSMCPLPNYACTFLFQCTIKHSQSRRRKSRGQKKEVKVNNNNTRAHQHINTIAFCLKWNLIVKILLLPAKGQIELAKRISKSRYTRIAHCAWSSHKHTRRFNERQAFL